MYLLLRLSLTIDLRLHGTMNSDGNISEIREGIDKLRRIYFISVQRIIFAAAVRSRRI